MGKVKEETIKQQIIKAAGHYLCAENAEDLYNEYLKLLDASEAGDDDCLAADYAAVWQPLENSMTVAKMIELIENDVETPELPEFLKKIDWKLLQEQKTILLVVINELNDPAKQEGLEGILQLLDSFQDAAVDVYGLKEEDVFSQDEEIEVSTGIKDSKGTELKIGDKTLTKVLCAGCNSDNLDMNRTNPTNKKEVWCNDCEDFHATYEAIFKSKKYKVEGFQVVSNDDGKGDIHPLMAGSFCLYNLSQAREMLEDRPGKNLFNEWRLLTIWTGDVEEPTKMFKGNPRK